MGTHTAARDEPLTSKLHTHCRYRHRPRQHLDPSSLPGCGSGSDPGGLGGCGDTDGHRGDGCRAAPSGPAGMLGTPRKGRRDPKTLAKPHGGGGKLRQSCRAPSSPRRNPRHPTLGTAVPLSPRAPHAGMLSPRAAHAGDAAPRNPTQGRCAPGQPTQEPHAGDTWDARTLSPRRGHSDLGTPRGDTEDAAPEHPTPQRARGRLQRSGTEKTPGRHRKSTGKAPGRLREGAGSAQRGGPGALQARPRAPAGAVPL